MNESPATTAPARPRWIDTRDVAKLIRKHLKQNFAGVKFSVRLDRYAGGSSINVGWVDGPTQAEVEKVTHPFQGARFDGMIDLAYCASQWYCDEHGARVAEVYGHGSGLDAIGASRCCAKAEHVNMGVSYIHERRELSDEFTAELAAQVRKESGMPAEGDLLDVVPETSIHAYGWTRVREAAWRLSQGISR
jgi:hypothetical protein